MSGRRNDSGDSSKYAGLETLDDNQLAQALARDPDALARGYTTVPGARTGARSSIDDAHTARVSGAGTGAGAGAGGHAAGQAQREEGSPVAGVPRLPTHISKSVGALKDGEAIYVAGDGDGFSTPFMGAASEVNEKVGRMKSTGFVIQKDKTNLNTYRVVDGSRVDQRARGR